MLINALCDYYDLKISTSDDNIPDGFSEQIVHFRIMLDTNGIVKDIIDIRIEKEITQKNGKSKMILEPDKIILPERSQKTSVNSNIIEHRPLYIFGLNYESEGFTTIDKTGKAVKSHNAFVEKNSEFFSDLNSDICKAYYNFICNWNPDEESQNEQLKKLGKAYNNAYFSFGLNGHPEIRLEEDKEFIEKYNSFISNQNSENTSEISGNMCAILGKELPIARIHDKIKLPGGNSTGCVLVGMKETAYESYGKTQSFNSNISEEAMKKYTQTLNKLLSDKNHHTTIDDMTLIYFAMKQDDDSECGFFSSFFSNDKSNKRENEIDNVIKNAKSGADSDLSQITFDEKVVFYVCGLTPNSSRISQKFLYRDSFSNIAENIIQHQNDLNITDKKKQIYFSFIFKELISPKSSKDKVPSPLMSGIIMAALQNTAYPDALLSTVVRRVKTDSDTEDNKFIKLNDTRAGIIKACLNRKSRRFGKKEEITVSLDKTNSNPAYLCGRLFAVLEKIQMESSGGKLNKTIKDSYFSSACSRPSVIFPKLIQLSQNHLRNLEKQPEGYAKRYTNLIIEITNNFNNEFPKMLDLDAQGAFIIGYYQQNKDFYTKSEKNEKGEEKI